MPETAVVANGGILLKKGEVDKAWAKHMSKCLNDSASMAEMQGLVASLRRLEGFKLFGEADDMFFYMVMHTKDYDVEAVEHFRAVFENKGWSLHIHGRKIYFIPHSVSKGRALAHLRETMGLDMVVSAGDSTLDKPLETVADYFIVPAHGHINSNHMTPESGIDAGLYITQTALDLLENE